MASLLTVVGIIWDISWHTSIGRDGLLSPPHLLVYMGAILGGLFSGVQVFINSFTQKGAPHNTLIKVWGIFYASLGGMVCIWGALAMLTSAPFDDWWHNIYGLDVTILSPPHSLLALGMLFLQFGACISVSKYLRHHTEAGGVPTRLHTRLRWLFIMAASSLLTMLLTLASEYLDTRNQRTGLFYAISIPLCLLFFPALARALGTRWAATHIAFGYFFILAVCNWVLQIFPATPKLGPIYHHVTHFQPLMFPVLLMMPALVWDVVHNKLSKPLAQAGFGTLGFGLVLLVVQFSISGFLLQSPHARNWFFGSHSWYFGSDPTWEYRYRFAPWELDTLPQLGVGVALGLILGFGASLLSLRWGRWLKS
ncbi:MAG TPA: hypothetical protein PKD90_19255, partial [Phnomibacter sp.]|nr:hypothetical protein [Phnomibacter sp.]